MDFYLFQADCEAAVAEYYRPDTDGPLLVDVRLQAIGSLVTTGWLTYPEYAAVIGQWPAVKDVKHYDSPEVAIAALVATAKLRWQKARLTEAAT